MAKLEILECFLDSTEPVSAADIAARTNLPRSSVFRDLRALVDSGHVRRNSTSRKYVLGPRVLKLGMIARAQLGVNDAVTVPLMKLAAEAGETVTFSIFDPPWRTCIFVADGPSDLRHVIQVGARYPLHLGAAGKIILANLSPFLAEAALEAADLSKPEKYELMTALADAKEAGYVISTGDRVPGATAVAAPVFLGETLTGSLAITGPTELLEPSIDAYRRLVVEAASEVSAALSAH